MSISPLNYITVVLLVWGGEQEMSNYIGKVLIKQLPSAKGKGMHQEDVVNTEMLLPTTSHLRYNGL